MSIVWQQDSPFLSVRAALGRLTPSGKYVKFFVFIARGCEKGRGICGFGDKFVLLQV